MLAKYEDFDKFSNKNSKSLTDEKMDTQNMQLTFFFRSPSNPISSAISISRFASVKMVWAKYMCPLFSGYQHVASLSCSVVSLREELKMFPADHTRRWVSA